MATTWLFGPPLIPDTTSTAEVDRILKTSDTQYPVVAFDDTTQEVVDFETRIEGYAGGGFKIDIWSAFASATGATNKARIGFSFERMNSGKVLDAAFTQTFDEVSIPADATDNNKIIKTTLNMTNINGLADGEAVSIRVRRNVGHADDNATGDWLLLWAQTGLQEQ